MARQRKFFDSPLSQTPTRRSAAPDIGSQLSPTAQEFTPTQQSFPPPNSDNQPAAQTQSQHHQQAVNRGFRPFPQQEDSLRRLQAVQQDHYQQVQGIIEWYEGALTSMRNDVTYWRDEAELLEQEVRDVADEAREHVEIAYQVHQEHRRAQRRSRRAAQRNRRSIQTLQDDLDQAEQLRHNHEVEIDGLHEARFDDQAAAESKEEQYRELLSLQAESEGIISRLHQESTHPPQYHNINKPANIEGKDATHASFDKIEAAIVQKVEDSFWQLYTERPYKEGDAYQVVIRTLAHMARKAARALSAPEGETQNASLRIASAVVKIVWKAVSVLDLLERPDKRAGLTTEQVTHVAVTAEEIEQILLNALQKGFNDMPDKTCALRQPYYLMQIRSAKRCLIADRRDTLSNLWFVKLDKYLAEEQELLRERVANS